MAVTPTAAYVPAMMMVATSADFHDDRCGLGRYGRGDGRRGAKKSKCYNWNQQFFHGYSLFE